ncbi:beta-glucosidase [Entomortierella parvispora]|uniref:beta-glucosidase n=1 Tax=Entomortierella parvispora TaxID=205924 RepID=A0A9P3LT64_9FUNG|nr:beta-glucosidase [Entomortierella parvispora]
MFVEADNLNPQQQTSREQIIDQDTYGGKIPDPTYWYQDNSQADLSNPQPSGPSNSIDPDILQLAESMTLKELAGQMTQIQIELLIGNDGELDMGKVQYWIREWGVGSFLDTPSNHGGRYISYSAIRFAKVVDAIQKVALENGKRVPIIYGLDSVHGANYVDGAVLFPQEIGLAATFNTTLAYEAGRITARDTRAAGIPWVFAPILDIAVHKLWPRVYESFGEDPHVVATMGSAIIRGLQGDYKTDRSRVAACMKHFIGYSASRNGQDKSSAWIPDNYLMDYFVPPFQAAVDSGVATAMETYIDVNGQPVVGSHFYLTELLRYRMGFEGMLVTDWNELDRLFTEHRTVPSLKDATLQCIKQTSVDMVMVPQSDSFSRDSVALVQEGQLNRTRLLQSAAKVLQLKKDLGLFDQPMSDPDLLSQVGSQQDINAARDAARESITVLKNSNSVLPLTGNKKIFVTGPAADSIRALSGGWSIKWQGAENDDWYQNRGETILQGLKHEFGEQSVASSWSVDFDGNGDYGGDYLSKIQDADAVVLCLGEKPYAEIVGNLNSLDLPWGQLEVVRRITRLTRGTKTKVILVLVEGRPRGLQEVADSVDAIVMAYLPGPWGGLPIAEVLRGTVNPSGRLPITYPSGPSDMTANYYRSGVDPYTPLFPFSAGLSYSTVEYQGLTLSKSSLHTTTSDGDDEVDPESEIAMDPEEEIEENEDDDEEGDGEEDDYDQDNGDEEEEEEEDNDRVLVKRGSTPQEAMHHYPEMLLSRDLSEPVATNVQPARALLSVSIFNSNSVRRKRLPKVDDKGKAKEEDKEGSSATAFDASCKGENSRKHQHCPSTTGDGNSDSIVARVTIQNSGSRAVKETVFWYITPQYRSEVMPEAFLLKGFEKVQLEPGQSKVVTFEITRSALEYHGRNLQKKVERGVFKLTVNAMRPEALSVTFQVV